MMLIFTQELWDHIREVAYRTRLETGVTLFGTKDGERRIVKAIADPGQNGTHEYAHYSGDEDHASQVFDQLRRDDPSIEWLGELHAHPPGMTWLSGGDRRTVKEILTGTDDTYHPDEFIAGVIQRVSGSIVIYPLYFTKTNLEGEDMEVLYGTSICQKPDRARSIVAKAYRYCRCWNWRQHHRRHGSPDGNGQNHAD
jgi:proteasome lid subunit RPN8/RPN11